MKLDEPIIGLNYLDEVPCNDPQAGPRYTCRLCHQTAHLAEMVRHVIGRKHRQKYVEVKRPDLVMWDKQSIITQGGKIIRAKAEIIERQDGRGSPLLVAKKMNKGKLNISRVPLRLGQKSLAQRDGPLHPPQLRDFQHEPSNRGRYPTSYPNTPRCHPEDPYMLKNRDRHMYQQEDTLSQDSMREELQRADHSESDAYRRDCLDPDYRRGYEEKYVEEPQRRAILERGRIPGRDLREESPHQQAQHVEYYPEEAPPQRRPYPERDQLKEFYSEEVRRRRVCSAEYQQSQPLFPEGNNQRWSLDRESGRHNSMNRACRQGPTEPGATRRSFPAPMESDRSSAHMFNTIRGYGLQRREPHHEEAVANPRPGQTVPPNSQRQVELTTTMCNIPEPFRRFLKGSANDEGHGKRKRKSRFSDATAEEVETTKEMFSDEYGPPNPKFGGRPRPEIHGAPHPDLYVESQSSRHAESYRGGGSESEGVFDILKNIEIENAEEADFLKNKLCNLLKEFKNKKADRAGQNNQVRAAFAEDYDSLKPEPELSPRHQYETTLRQDSDLRQPEDLYFKEDHGERGWKRHERAPDHEYHHPGRGETRHSNRSCYEEGFGWPEMSQSSHASHPDEPASYPEWFQEPMRPRDYRPAAAEGFVDSHTSAPPIQMERGARMDRGRRYSNNLDKITSTLLELVARK
ncbi:uncharacterized protein [Pempheris klunzingeri]